jgi:2-dehydro-3-deoxy-D-gluconate 5-dehydrogenase
MTRLTDKVAVITGGGRGIGQALALRLAQEGTHVVAVDIDSTLSAHTASQVAALGRKSLALQADVTRRADIERMVQRSVEAMGRIDILMNNAGVIRFQEMQDITEEDWDFVCNVNLKGAFFVMQAVARQMIQQGTGGKIVNTASVMAAFLASPDADNITGQAYNVDGGLLTTA